MSYLIVAAEIRSQSVAYELLVNGAVVVRDVVGEQAMRVQKLNPFLLEGEPNRIELSVSAPAGLEEAPDDATLSLKVLQGEPGQHPGPAGMVLEHDWDRRKAPVRMGSYHVSLDKELGVAQTHGRWAWQDAQGYQDADRPAVEALVAGYHAALHARDVGGVEKLTVVRDGELARGFDVPLAAIVAEERDVLQAIFATDWQMDPLYIQALELTPRAGGRLVDVTGPAKAPPIRGRADGEPVSFDVTVSHLSTGWVIIR